ncbi:rRNA-binding ribosome biosynthesis protein rpf2 [Naganishia albida]|nr:rRNA-binding ribosome biosynthesis protein rpf2 [Naganishia albida]
MAMLRTIKPKNARSKRILDAREPQLVENEKTAIFVKGEKTSEPVRIAMKDLHALKLPHSINFNKKNPIHPFDVDPTRGVQSLEFFSNKNDASLFVVGMHSKKRPNGLVWVRCFDGQVLDMIEIGLEKAVPMSEFKTTKMTPGHRFLMCFQSDLFSTHPSYILLKSMLLDFYNGHEVDEIPIEGLEAVMTITAGPLANEATSAMEPTNGQTDLVVDAAKENLPTVHLRVYNTKVTAASGTKTPQVALTEMGPRLDFQIRRIKFPAEEMMQQALRRAKMEKKNIEKGLGKKKKNIELDAMGDLVGKIHLGRQELKSLQSRKMKGLKEAKEPKKRASDEASGGGEGRGKAKRAKKAAADVDVAME